MPVSNTNPFHSCRSPSWCSVTDPDEFRRSLFSIGLMLACRQAPYRKYDLLNTLYVSGRRGSLPWSVMCGPSRYALVMARNMRSSNSVSVIVTVLLSGDASSFLTHGQSYSLTTFKKLTRLRVVRCGENRTRNNILKKILFQTSKISQ